jgi:hypothetical protein
MVLFAKTIITINGGQLLLLHRSPFFYSTNLLVVKGEYFISKNEVDCSKGRMGSDLKIELLTPVRIFAILRHG